ncbi:hypothetical protein SRHO_G00147850 [Serrasalmus rhombeus]
MHSYVKAFEVKLGLLLKHVKERNFCHLPTTQKLAAEEPSQSFPTEKCAEALEILQSEFQTYPNLKKHALKMTTIFGSTYICEQTFSSDYKSGPPDRLKNSELALWVKSLRTPGLHGRLHLELRDTFGSPGQLQILKEGQFEGKSSLLLQTCRCFSGGHPVMIWSFRAAAGSI